MIDGQLLGLFGGIFLICGFGYITLGPMGNFGLISEPRKKDYSFPIGMALILVGLALLIPGIHMEEKQSKIEMNELCESIDMEFLKKSTGGLFGNNYVLCYDEETKQIKEIPV